MSVGDFYADPKNNIYFGRALIEAYTYGENQDWIGLLLTPSAIEKISQYEIDTKNLLNYANMKVPYKKNNKDLISELPAYIIGEHSIVNGENLCIKSLINLRSKIKEQSILKKYDRTINFLKLNKRRNEI